MSEPEDLQDTGRHGPAEPHPKGECPSFRELVALVARLRDPGGCPWDRKQTHISLRPHLLEESYELLEAIDAGDEAGIAEELGDLLVHVAFHSDMGRRAGAFTAQDVLDQAYQKLIRRHPHVFGDDRPIESADQVVERWEEIKRREGKTRRVADAVPSAMPALAYAAGIQHRVEQSGIEWRTGNAAEVQHDLPATLRARLQALVDADAPDREEAVGRLLFEMVRDCREMSVDPETALRRASQAFRDRIERVEESAGTPLSEMSEDQRNRLWQESG